MTVESLLAEALRLNDEDRRLLAEALWDSLEDAGGTGYQPTPAMLEVVRQRQAEYGRTCGTVDVAGGVSEATAKSGIEARPRQFRIRTTAVVPSRRETL